MESEMDSVVATAAATLSREIYLRPLRALCVRKIALSLKFYVDIGVTSLHSYLLPKLCEEVFESYKKQLFHEKKEIFWMKQDAGTILYRTLPKSEILQIASLFVGAGLKHFDIDVLSTHDVNDGLEDWKLFFDKLIDGSPTLSSFYFQLSIFYGRIEFPSINQPASYYISFQKMTSLRTLRVGPKLVFTNADLQIVCTSCTLLQILDITLCLSVTNEEGLCHLQKLKMLEHLLFLFDGPIKGWTICDVEKNAERIEFCLLTIPKLKINGYEVCDYIKEMDNYHSFSIFEEKEDPVELGLEHLKLSACFPPANVLLPHVTHLEVYGAEALNFCLKQTFPKLKVLVVDDVSWNDLVKLLRHLGNPLVKLHTERIEGGNDDLLVVSRCCLQLEHLDLWHVVCVKKIAPTLMASRNELAKIKHLTLRFDRCSQPGHSDCQAKGLLKFLMTCPDLEYLDLDTAAIPQDEVDEVAAGIAAGAYLCLPKLRNLSISINEQAIIGKESKLNFVKQVVAHCPKLEEIFFCGFSCKNKLGPLKGVLDKFDRGHVMFYLMRE